MAVTYLGPAKTLILPNGKHVEKGGTVSIGKAARAALEAAGHRFSDTDDTPAPQSAAENLAEEGSSAEQAAADSGLSVGAEKSKK